MRAWISLCTRVDPCIKCTRCKLATGEVTAAFVGPKRLFVSLWDRVSWLRLPVVSALDGSWSLLGRPGLLLAGSWAVMGLSWATLGPSWRVLGRFWPLLGDTGRPPGSLMGCSWRLLGASWALLAAPVASLGRSGRLLGPSCGAPVPLLASCGLSLGVWGRFWGHLGREGAVCGLNCAKPLFF